MKNAVLASVTAAIAAIAGSVTSASAIVLYDNATTLGTVGAFSTSSVPNTFMGDGYNLLAGSTSITGFDVYPVNVTGVNYNAIKITIYVWDNVNTTGTVNATTPAFSGLLATYVLTSTGSFNTGFYFPFESAMPGVTPGITLASPLAISDSQIGLTFAYQGSTDGGTTFASANNLTSIIGGNAACTVGSNVFSGYYRNAGSPTETNGNFTSSLRALGGLSNQSLAVRVYGVPAPASLALLAPAGLIVTRRRRA